MKKDILTSRFVKEMSEATANMYRQGWDERNGGNISMMLEEGEIEQYEYSVIRQIPIEFDASALAGKVFIVTGTGKYFKNVEKDPENNLGVVRIREDGKSVDLLWGWREGGQFTSEFPAHLMSHIARLKKDEGHRVVMHTHPTYTIAMNGVCPIDEADFTHKLWQSNTEAVVVFPDGVGILPAMVCGTNEIGEATAKKMDEYRLVVWTNHGIYGTGKDMDEAFGLIETVEKTAQLYMLQLGRCVNIIPDEIISGLAKRYGLTPKAGVLKD